MRRRPSRSAAMRSLLGGALLSLVLGAALLAACEHRSSDDEGPNTTTSSSADGGGMSATIGSGGANASQGNGGSGGSTPVPCTTRITYGSRWVRPADHPSDVDVVDGLVTWDGLCALDGANAYATLSNGWKPYFTGHDGCIVALDHEGDCGLPPAPCSTRIGYGPSWLAPRDHPASYDDVSGVVFGDDLCRAEGGNVRATRLSNGWDPHFADECQLSFRYLQCGGLTANPVIATDCPDPGVLQDGESYVLACTGGAFGSAFPLRTSKDLVRWEPAGFIFPGSGFGSWSVGDYWAPEIHRVGSSYVAYYSARHASGHLAVGAAVASSPLGPYTDVGAPLVHEQSVGHIDAHVFEDDAGTHYLVWKDDGNAFGLPTPIWAQALTPDGLARTGPKVKLLTNDLPWEGPLVEGPWVVRHDGAYYLFYSANTFYDTKYAVGVARSANPLGPYEKHGPPLIVSGGAWSGPGHGTVTRGPRGEDVFVYHAWRSDHVNEAPGRLVLVDRIEWNGAWPALFGAPSSSSRPPP